MNEVDSLNNNSMNNMKDAHLMNNYSVNNNHSNKVTPINSVSHQLTDEFTIYWNNLTVFVNSNHNLCKSGKKAILRNVSGCFKSGQISAIMGPSGSGKSTLLNCLAGRWKDGQSDQIYYDGYRSNIDLSFIPQFDNYFQVLTAEEAIVFACKLQTATKIASKKNVATIWGDNRLTVDNRDYHHLIAQQLLKLLGLYEVKNVRVGRLSGGEKKRLSVAQELVSKPDILILDEPTSGLDSSASYQLIDLFKSLAIGKPSMAIVITIHQPSVDILQLLDTIYVLSNRGQCIYHDCPSNLLDHLAKLGYSCPSFQNPADYLLQLITNSNDHEAVHKLFQDNLHQLAAVKVLPSQMLRKPLKSMTFQLKYPHFHHFWILLNRSFLLIRRDPDLAIVRISSHIGMALFLGWIYGPKIGEYGGCPPELGNNFDVNSFRNASEKVFEETRGLMDNFSSIFFNLIMLMFSSLTAMLITFPLEVPIFIKEKCNGWYSTGPYYLARTLADLPFQLMSAILYVCITYWLNGQIRELWRFEYYLIVSVLISLLGQSHGLIVGAIFVHQMTAAVFLGPLTAMPLLLFSGFMVKIETIPTILQPLTTISYLRYGFEGVLLSLYGHARCGEHTTEKINQMKAMFGGWLSKMLIIANRAINDDDDDDNDDENAMNDDSVKSVKIITQSLTETIFNSFGGGLKNSNSTVKSGVMMIYNLEDAYLNRALWSLTINLIIFRIAIYLLIKWRAKL